MCTVCVVCTFPFGARSFSYISQQRRHTNTLFSSGSIVEAKFFSSSYYSFYILVFHLNGSRKKRLFSVISFLFLFCFHSIHFNFNLIKRDSQFSVLFHWIQWHFGVLVSYAFLRCSGVHKFISRIATVKEK